MKKKITPEERQKVAEILGMSPADIPDMVDWDDENDEDDEDEDDSDLDELDEDEDEEEDEEDEDEEDSEVLALIDEYRATPEINSRMTLSEFLRERGK